ncbi:TetR/AcrR family transcriptional regulator [Brevibacterium spongiae]|uniref:TetR family transcriptional regulator C-terminal domain-containing protein n=1 Tax=Brevibacterium spongiae TaxID=2909672 RepID=A0ABY5SQJ2_9MICO|nr:TetR/AcrR family transcriptional regulator [Brevibacterium spongiae]UVI36827.1 TetR family transcriptional regulator C-terminal domain-containing protein [Brevibacterium spongiae]
MPKIVDHDQRRRDLVQATLRLIARQGLDGATMRDIATEAGFANGVVKTYFGSKADLLAATYLFVFEATNSRVTISTQGQRGLGALRAFAHEVLPVTPQLRDEARVVLSYLAEVAQNPEHARATAETMELWRTWIVAWLEQARTDGELRGEADIESETEVLLTYLLGAQTTAIIGGRGFDFDGFRAQLDYVIGRLGRQS